MPLVYVEYISRLPHVSLESFHAIVSSAQSGWSGGYGDDVAVLHVGRTWRIGPEPGYMWVWYSPRHGLERIDDWERTFVSGEANMFEEPFLLVGRIDRAGCYEPLREPVLGTAGRYYAEHLDIAPGATHADVLAHYEERCARHPELELNLLIDRIGGLGPEPRALAVWGVPSWGHVEQIAHELDAVAEPVQLVTVSFFADFGKEQL